jgi:hypothetical protein
METTTQYLSKLRHQRYQARLSKNRSGLSTNTIIQVNECLEDAQHYAKDRRLKLSRAQQAHPERTRH